jgi:hypothetical protein
MHFLAGFLQPFLNDIFRFGRAMTDSFFKIFVTRRNDENGDDIAAFAAT